MYLIPIQVPIYVDGPDTLIGTEWHRSLELLRDSLQGRYGRLTVAAPFEPADQSAQHLEKPSPGDDIDLVPLFPLDLPARQYWLDQVQRKTTGKLIELLESGSVVHGTVADPLRPFSSGVLERAARRGVPTIFVLDQDDRRSMLDLARHAGLATRIKTRAMAALYRRQCRKAALAADLCLFKGHDTIAAFGRYSKELLRIEDTSYREREMVPAADVHRRLASLLEGRRSLDLCFAGRLVHLKGLDRSIRLIADARARGANLTLSIIGAGPEERGLRDLAGERGVSDHIRFLGNMQYGAGLLATLGECDAVLFNPRMSETPRLIFDAYAAGLPVVADDISYVRERHAAEGAVVPLPWNDDSRAVEILLALDRDRTRLERPTMNALEARIEHAAESWYKRRAEATHDMVARVREMQRTTDTGDADDAAKAVGPQR